MTLSFTICGVNMEDRTFNAVGPDGRPVVCHLNNPDRDWDKMMASIGKTVELAGSIMATGYFVVMSII